MSLNPTGFVLPAAAIGLGSLLIRPLRGFFPDAPSSSVTVGAGGVSGEVVVQAAQPLIPQVTIEELHHDELEITDHPVEYNAPITDHAFIRPSEVIIRCAWSNSPNNPLGIVGAAIAGKDTGFVPFAMDQTVAAFQSVLNNKAPNQVDAIYEKLLKLQRSRIPFDIFTGKRAYNNMLFRSLSVTTDRNTENALMLTAICRQVLIVFTQNITVPINVNAQSLPQQTTPTQDVGNQKLLPGFNYASP